MTDKTFSPAPKPRKPRSPKKRPFSSIKQKSYEEVKQLASGAPPRKRPKRANPKRKASEFKRCYGSSARCEWIKSLPCAVYACRNRNVENAHLIDDGTKGMGRKSGYATVGPLCRYHHTEGDTSLHVLGRRLFEERHGLDLKSVAARVEINWRAFNGDTE